MTYLTDRQITLATFALQHELDWVDGQDDALAGELRTIVTRLQFDLIRRREATRPAVVVTSTPVRAAGTAPFTDWATRRDAAVAQAVLLDWADSRRPAAAVIDGRPVDVNGLDPSYSETETQTALDLVRERGYADGAADARQLATTDPTELARRRENAILQADTSQNARVVAYMDGYATGSAF